MSLPLAAVPLPAGRPRPSGNTVMSMALILSSLAGLPMRASCPKAPRLRSATRAAILNALRNMRHAPIGSHIPDLDLIVVIAVIAAARSQHFVSGWLQITGLIGGARLQRRRAAVPIPRHSEAREGFGETSLLQLGVLPTFAVIDRNLDALDLAAPGPRETGDLIHARSARHLLPARPPRNHRLRLQLKAELTSLAIRQQVRVVSRFVRRHRR